MLRDDRRRIDEQALDDSDLVLLRVDRRREDLDRRRAAAAAGRRDLSDGDLVLRARPDDRFLPRRPLFLSVVERRALLLIAIAGHSR